MGHFSLINKSSGKLTVDPVWWLVGYLNISKDEKYDGLSDLIYCGNGRGEATMDTKDLVFDES